MAHRGSIANAPAGEHEIAEAAEQKIFGSHVSDGRIIDGNAGQWHVGQIIGYVYHGDVVHPDVFEQFVVEDRSDEAIGLHFAIVGGRPE